MPARSTIQELVFLFILHMHKSGNSGNILFLILIAVALFAALSYVITSSMRSSGGVQKEKDDLILSEFFNQAMSMRSSVVRYQVSQGRPPVLARTDGGLYFPSLGNIELYPPQRIHDETLVPEWLYIWILTETRARVQGIEVGSESQDLYLIVQGIKENFCEMINENLLGSSTIPVATNGPPTSSYIQSGILRNGADFYDAGPAGAWDLPHAEGCFSTGAFAGGYAVFFQVAER